MTSLHLEIQIVFLLTLEVNTSETLELQQIGNKAKCR